MGDKEAEHVPQTHNDSSQSSNQDSKRKAWVKFEDESLHDNVPLPEVSSLPGTSAKPTTEIADPSQEALPAVLKTETVQVNLEAHKHTEPTASRLTKNVEFVNVRQGFGKFSCL